MYYVKLILKIYVYVFYFRFLDVMLFCNVKDKVFLIYLFNKCWYRKKCVKLKISR